MKSERNYATFYNKNLLFFFYTNESDNENTTSHHVIRIKCDVNNFCHFVNEFLFSPLIDFIIHKSIRF